MLQESNKINAQCNLVHSSGAGGASGKEPSVWETEGPWMERIGGLHQTSIVGRVNREICLSEKEFVLYLKLDREKVKVDAGWDVMCCQG